MGMMKEKIKVMNMIWSMADGGAQRVVLNWLRVFRDDPDIEFTLFVYCKPEDSFCNRVIQEEHYPVVYLNNPRSRIKIPYINRIFDRKIARKTWIEAIRDFKPDIVHGHIAEMLASTLTATIINRIPVCFTTIHSNPNRDRGYILNIIRRAFAKGNVVPVCLSKEHALLAKKRYGFGQYEIIPNGIEFAVIRNRILSKSEARKKLKLTRDVFVIAGVGRLHPIKNFPLLLDTFREVVKIRPNAMLVIAGAGRQLRGLKTRAERAGIASQVRFLGNLDDVIPVYCAADVLGIPSISEASPMTLLEAQCCGTRCVISSGVPTENIITDKVCKMPKNATAIQWAEALLDDDYIGGAVCKEADYELLATVAKLKNMYLRYWSNYRDGRK